MEQTGETSLKAENMTKMERNDHVQDRSKFKKVEMPVFNGSDPDSWLFRADHYFNTHKLSDSKKLMMVVISFEEAVLDWFKSKEERELFKDWKELKARLLLRFRLSKKGSICDQARINDKGI